MKISQKQAGLLAKEILSQLKAKKAQKISEEVRNKLKVFIEKREELKKKDKAINEELDKHDQSLYAIVGKLRERIYRSDSLQAMVEKLEQKALPNVSEIENEIILKSLFSNESDLQKFVDSIVEKYIKKAQSKVLLN